MLLKFRTRKRRGKLANHNRDVRTVLGKKKAKTPWNLDSELNQSQAALKCKSLANFLTSSIMIFIYSTYCAAHFNFTFGKILLLRQIFNF